MSTPFTVCVVRRQDDALLENGLTVGTCTVCANMWQKDDALAVDKMGLNLKTPDGVLSIIMNLPSCAWRDKTVCCCTLARRIYSRALAAHDDQ